MFQQWEQQWVQLWVQLWAHQLVHQWVHGCRLRSKVLSSEHQWEQQ
jgi:hypothetical protein